MNGYSLQWFRGRILGLVAAASMLACGDLGDPDAAGVGQGVASDVSEAIAALGVSRAAEPLPGLVTAAQPTREQIDGLRALGYERFVSLRQPTEDGAGWEETYFAGEPTGFSRISVSGAADLTRAKVEELDQLLDTAGDEGVVLYCASSNRVGALLALRAYWLDGAEPEAALALGRRAGLAGLEPAVRDLLDGAR